MRVTAGKGIVDRLIKNVSPLKHTLQLSSVGTVFVEAQMFHGTVSRAWRIPSACLRKRLSCKEAESPKDLLVESTEGFSGSDISLVCKEAAMQPLRRLMTVLEDRKEIVPEEELPKVGPIKREDIQTALRNTRPSEHLHAHRYDKFNKDYGSQIL